jgi:hypothetical protein
VLRLLTLLTELPGNSRLLLDTLLPLLLPLLSPMLPP